jgi:hypothetical protein
MSSSSSEKQSKYIEVFSSSRNRNLYPNPSSFDIPFSSQYQYDSKEQVTDPIINGAIYYKFPLTNYKGIIPIGSFIGKFQPGTDLTTMYLDPNQTPFYSQVNNFYKGYILRLNIVNSYEAIIRTYDPLSGKVTINVPWKDMTNQPSAGIEYQLYTTTPATYYVNIPSIDINGNSVLNYELAYNGYYLVFESYNKNYSNPSNSNIFFRKISYYDYTTQNAYFEEPLTFDYGSDFSVNYFNLRKTLPFERWTLEDPTYINGNIPLNPLIGPLIGPVIKLPQSASNIDNFYKGKYVYNYSAKGYISPEYPPPESLSYSISSDIFYPIYGCYYIKSYNGITKELSISQDINYIKSCVDKKILLELPTIKNINVHFIPEGDFDYITEISPGIFRAYFKPLDPNINVIGKLIIDPKIWTLGKTYKITLRIKKTNNMNCVLSSPYGIVEEYSSENIEDYYKTFIYYPSTPNPYYYENIYFDIEATNSSGNEPYFVEWDLFEMTEIDVINICDFSKENFTPLDYNGSTTSQENTTCYELSLSSVTLPNIPLETGSKISFYPYVYIVITNTTSPSKASEELIYSNNPKSDKAVFIAPVGLQVNPNTGTFLSLYSNMTQKIKFKPNDNLRFEVYLPDGSPFKTLLNDTYTPYPPDPRVQIEAIFSIVRSYIVMN